MPASRQQEMLTSLFENLPGLAFLILTQTVGDLRLSGWVGTLLALLVCLSYVTKRVRPDTIVLGINLFMVVITPLIESLYRAGYDVPAGALVDNIGPALLTCIFVTGLALTLMRSDGFLGHAANTKRQTLRYSGLLLSVSGLSIFWSLAVGESRLVALVLPLTALFGLRRYLVARLADHEQSDSNGTLLATAIAPASQTDASI